MAADADDGDAGHATGTYIWTRTNPARTRQFESRTGRGETSQECEVQPSLGCEIGPPTEPIMVYTGEARSWAGLTRDRLVPHSY
jgi:hypothetical protein